jgi:hypothetical protein
MRQSARPDNPSSWKSQPRRSHSPARACYDLKIQAIENTLLVRIFHCVALAYKSLRWPYSVQRCRTLRGRRLLQRRATPGVLHHWTSIKSTGGAHSINSSQITESVSTQRRHRLAQDHARRVGVRLRGNCLLFKRFGKVQPSTASPGLGRLFDWLRSRHLSKMHHSKIEVIHFASVTYLWHSPCISRYCRNVDSQIQQPMMSCQ